MRRHTIQIETAYLTHPYPDFDFPHETDLIVINEGRYIMV